MFLSLRNYLCGSTFTYVVSEPEPEATRPPEPEAIEPESSTLNIYTPNPMDYLDNVVYADTQIYIPDICAGKVVKVYDADTITIANRISAHNPQIYRFQIRLAGIDTPEVKSKNVATKTHAIHARDVLAEMIFGKIVSLKNVKLEKYGRLLADVYLGELHLNQWLIDNKYAVVYDGGTKMIPAEWEM